MLKVFCFEWISLFHPPVCVESCNGLPSVGVQWLCLLQQDRLHQPGDVNTDVAGEAVEAGCVGSYSGQEVRGARYLLGGLVVIGHSHDDSGETRINKVAVTNLRAVSRDLKVTNSSLPFTFIRLAQLVLQCFPTHYNVFGLFLSIIEYIKKSPRSYVKDIWQIYWITL